MGACLRLVGTGCVSLGACLRLLGTGWSCL